MKSIYYKGCNIIQHYGYVQIRFPDGTGWNADTVQEARKEIDHYKNHFIKYRGFEIRADEEGFTVFDHIYNDFECCDTLAEAKEYIDGFYKEGAEK